MNTLKLYDYINNLISLAETPENFEKCKFAILCDKYPIQANSKKYIAKVIYISIKTDKRVWRIYPDKIKQYDIEHIQLTANLRRKLSYKMNEFFVNGDNNEQEYNENKYYNYSIEMVDNKTKELIEALRKKYNLEIPELFIGEHQNLVLD